MFRDSKAAFWFILPALVFLCLFKIWPIAVSLGESFMQTSISEVLRGTGELRLSAA